MTRRVLRSLVRLALVLVVLGALVGAAAYVALETHPVRVRLSRLGAEALGDLLGAQVEIGDWRRTDGLSVAVEGIRVSIEGRPFVTVDHVAARPTFLSLWPIVLALDLEVSDFDVRIGRGPDGVLDIERLTLEGGEGEGEEPVSVSDIHFTLDDGRVRIEEEATEPIVFTGLAGTADLSLAVAGEEQFRVARLDAVQGGLALDIQGTLDLADLDLDVEVSAQGRAAGLIAEAMGLDPALALELHAAVGGTIEHPVADFVADAAGATAAGRLAVGTTPAGETSLAVSWQAEHIDPVLFVAEAPAGRVEGFGRLFLVPALGLAGVRGEAVLQDATLAGFRFDQLLASAHEEGGRLVYEVHARASARAWAAAASGHLDLAAPWGAAAHAEVALEDAAALPGELADWLAATRVRGRLDVAGSRVLEPDRELEVRAALEPGEVRGLKLDRAAAHAVLAGDQLRVESFEVAAERTLLRGSGRAELAAGGAVEARVAGPVDLRLVPVGGLGGAVQAELAVSGKSDALDARLQLTSVERVTAADLAARFEASAAARALGSGRATATLEASGRGQPRGDLAETLGDEERDLALRATWTEAPSAPAPGGAASAAGTVSVAASAREPDGRTQSVDLVAAIEPARVALELRSLEIAPRDAAPWRLAAPARLAVTDASLEIAGLDVRSRDGAIRADGVLRRGAGANDLRASASGIDLALLCALADLGEPCAGRVEAELRARGTGTAPELDGSIAIPSARFDEHDYGAVRATLRADRRLRVDAMIGPAAAPDLRAGGSIGLKTVDGLPALDRASPIEAFATAAALPLDGFLPFAGGALTDLGGRASFEVRAGGTLDEPRLAGEATIADLLLTVAATGTTYRDGRVAILFRSNEVRFAELSLAEGTIQGGGTVDLVDFGPAAFALWVQLSDAPILERPEATGRASGRITLEGSFEAPRLEGDIVIGPATIRPTLAAAGGGPPPDPTIRVVRGPEDEDDEPDDALGLLLAGEAAPAETVAVPEDALFDRTSVAIAVRIGDRVVIQRTDAHVRLTGEIVVRKAPGGDIQLFGAIEAVNGWYIFQGRRLELEEAAVRFGGESPIDPTLDVRASARSGAYTVFVEVYGTLSEPALDLTSSPPLDQGDILSVLLFGKPSAELSGGQGALLQQQAVGVLAAYVAPELQRSLMDTFGLSAVTLSMPSADRAGTVGVGRYIGDDIFVSLAQDFGGPKGGTQRQLQGLIGTSVTVQYSLTPSLTLQTASSTEGESSVDVIWHRRY